MASMLLQSLSQPQRVVGISIITCMACILVRTTGFASISSRILRRDLGTSSHTSFATPLGKSISQLRDAYEAPPLVEANAPTDPFMLFEAWLKLATESDTPEPNAMCLATVDASGQPSNRFVLLKGFDTEAFTFYTNYNSRKSTELASNPKAASTFWWPLLQRSVRIEGTISKTTSEESDEYFPTRPIGSRLGAWASAQSSPIASREALQEKKAEVEKRFEGSNDIERPPHWGGFRLVPHRIEFWAGQPSRLHDRLVYSRDAPSGDWTLQRLQP